MHEADPRTFYLTDFLCRHFDRLVIHGLKIDTHPELLPMYFGNYRRLVYLAQTDDAELVEQGRRGRRAARARVRASAQRATATCDPPSSGSRRRPEAPQRAWPEVRRAG